MYWAIDIITDLNMWAEKYSKSNFNIISMIQNYETCKKTKNSYKNNFE